MAWARWSKADLGAWTSYTPSLKAVTTNPTLGTGSTATGAYCQIGKTVFCRFLIEFGSSGVNAGSGQYYVSLPVTAATFDARIHIGNARAYDSSAAVVLDARIRWYSTTGVDFAYANTYPTGSGQAFLSNAPWVWAAGDWVTGAFTYEAA